MSIYKDGKLIAGGRQCMPLLSFMWADHVLNDASWLRADTFSWQSGAVYQAAYNHLVDDVFIRASAWYDSNNNITRYTDTETPQVGDATYSRAGVYLSNRNDNIVSVTDNSITTNSGYVFQRQSVDDFLALRNLASSETIAGTTVYFYVGADNHKVALVNQESNIEAIYNATGVAWYYIIDTVNQKFKLPRTKFGFTGIRSGVGNYVEAGLPNITGNTHWIGAVLNNNNTSYANGVFSAFDKNNGAYAGGGGYGNAAGRLNFDASRSSSVYGSSSTVQPKATEMYLYFYVGNFTQTALENTAGLNTELFNGKADLSTVAHVVTEFQEPTADNGYTWYRKYADGWVEQGGVGSDTAGSVGFRTINFPITMSDTNYTATGIVYNSENNGVIFHIKFGNMTTTKMEVMTGYSGNKWGYAYGWQVSGMAAN